MIILDEFILYLAIALIFTSIVMIGVIAVVANVNFRKFIKIFRRGNDESELIRKVIVNYLKYRSSVKREIKQISNINTR